MREEVAKVFCCFHIEHDDASLVEEPCLHSPAAFRGSSFLVL
jgi:hypothetical protein